MDTTILNRLASVTAQGQQEVNTQVDLGPTVLVLDDLSLLSGSLAMVLTAEGCSVRTLKATTEAELSAELQRRCPRVALIRIHPGPSLMGSLALVRKASQAGALVAVLSDSTHELLCSAAVHAGAKGLIASSDLLIDTVDQILGLLNGRALITAEREAELLAIYENHRQDRDDRFSPFESLSRREGEVLMLLMEGHSVAKIAESSFVSVGTVRTQVKAVLRKLAVNSQAAAVAMAYRSGWPDSDPNLPVDLRLRRL